MPENNYEIPIWGSTTDRLHGWLMDARSEGEAWLAAQKQATTWAGAVSLMEDQDRATEATDQSNTSYPKSKRIARELVASLASFRHAGESVVSWDNSLYDTAHLLTDLDTDWEMTALKKMGNPHRAWLQNAVIKGTGYVVEEWDKHFWGPNKGDIRLTALDPADVTFVQLPSDRDIQRAYMVIIKYEMPINLAKRIYGPINPGFAASLVPDQESPSWLVKGLQKVQQFLSPALRVAGRTRQTANGSFPTVNIYRAYTMDGSLNRGYVPIKMGTGTNWEYTVPALGDALPTGIRNPSTGAEFTRPATEDDCLLFPLRRLTTFSNTGVCTDDTSPWWHGDVPVARAWFNDLPWNALGGSLISDGRTIEQGVNALMRGMEDSAAARLDPPALYDDTMVSSTWAQAVNPRKAGVRAAAALSQGNPIQFPVPPQLYDVGPWIPAFMDAQEQRMNYLAALPDMTAIAKAKQIPGADTQEKLFEMAGPIVQDLVRALEEPLTQLGNWRNAYRFQFFNYARVIRTVGPDEFDESKWNYAPDKLAEIRQNQSFQFRPQDLTGGQPPTTEKLKRLMSEFRYEVTESGINELHRMTTKLFYLQLMKEGFPISWWTFAKIAKIPNFGPPPEGTNTELERFIAQKHIQIELQADLQKELMQTQQEAGGDGSEPGPPGGGEPQDIPDISAPQRGRPQSYNRPPRLVQKSGGTRSTVTTS